MDKDQIRDIGVRLWDKLMQEDLDRVVTEAIGPHLKVHIDDSIYSGDGAVLDQVVGDALEGEINNESN